jgi:hypothetical protein
VMGARAEHRQRDMRNGFHTAAPDIEAVCVDMQAAGSHMALSHLGTTLPVAPHMTLNASTQIHEPAEAAACVPVTTISKVCAPGSKPVIE